MSVDPRLLAVAVEVVPHILNFIRAVFRDTHPDVPQPTDAEIIEAERQALKSSLAKDEAWLGAHPV